MKQSKDSKKQFPRNTIAWGLFLSLFILSSFFAWAEAQTVEELTGKINEKSADIEKIEMEIAKYRNQLSEIGKQKNTLASLIQQLDLTQKKLGADISLTQKKIDKTNLTIQSLTGEIGQKAESIDVNSEALAGGLRLIQEYDEHTLVETILSNEDFTSMWNDLDAMATLRESLSERIKNLKKIKGELEDTRNASIQAKAELTRLRTELGDQKKIVEGNKAEKNRILKETKNSEGAYQKLLKEQTARKAALEAEIRDYESKIKYILDPSSLPNAGTLSWPLENIYVTQMFGKTASSGRLYASGTHSGVDFRATVGTPVLAMADGVVGGVGDTDTTCPGASFGKWIFIEYENGLSSTYGHMSLNKVSAGQKVLRGEVVGYSGATGRVTGPHLHLTVYAPNGASVQTLPSKSCQGKTLTQPIAATNAYLDPMYYLPPYKQ